MPKSFALSVTIACLVVLGAQHEVLVVRGGGAKETCKETCGSVNIDYPFGIGKKCSLDGGFEVECKNDVPTLKAASRITHTIKEIRFPNQVILNTTETMAVDCRNTSPTQPGVNISLEVNSPFTISARYNRFRAMGCDTMATIRNNHGSFNSQCRTLWVMGNGDEKVGGLGQCQIALPERSTGFNYGVDDQNDYEKVACVMECSFAVLAEASFNISQSVLDGYYNDGKPGQADPKPLVPIPLALEWAIEDLRCNNSRSDTCGPEATCEQTKTNQSRYHCFCKEGCNGNPYLTGKDGCYGCKGPGNAVLIASLVGGFALAGALSAGAHSYGSFSQYKQALKLVKRTFDHFNNNELQGGLPSPPDGPPDTTFDFDPSDTSFDGDADMGSQEPLIPGDDSNTTKNFTKEDFKRCIKLARTGRRIYLLANRQRNARGSLTVNGKQIPIDVRKYTVQDQTQVEGFVKAVQLLSYLGKRKGFQVNMARLLAISTQKSSLIYLHFSDVTLYDCLHGRGLSGNRPSWDERLKIALGIARALAFAHAKGINHGNLKSSNVLVNKSSYDCKVVEFGVARIWRRATLVNSSRGYVDPEYSKMDIKALTKESDAYSFGVLLVELMTGKDPSSSAFNGLVMRLALAIKEQRLDELVDSKIWAIERREQVYGVADMAMKCIQETGKDRPSMLSVRNDILKWVRPGPGAQQTFHDSSGPGTRPRTGPGVQTMPRNRTEAQGGPRNRTEPEGGPTNRPEPEGGPTSRTEAAEPPYGAPVPEPDDGNRNRTGPEAEPETDDGPGENNDWRVDVELGADTNETISAGEHCGDDDGGVV